MSTINYNDKLIKINKVKAKKLFYEGKTILLIACNLNPYFLEGVNVITININNFKDIYNIDINNYFEKLVNEFIFYNCNNSYSGRYPHYYIKEN